MITVPPIRVPTQINGTITAILILKLLFILLNNSFVFQKPTDTLIALTTWKLLFISKVIGLSVEIYLALHYAHFSTFIFNGSSSFFG